MTPSEMEKTAVILEQTFPNQYYKKDHKQLISTMMILFTDIAYKDVAKVIKDYAENYDNAPLPGTIVKVVKRNTNKVETAVATPRLFDDNDGCTYYRHDDGHIECVFKWWWADVEWCERHCRPIRTKLQVLRERGLIK